MVTLAIPDWGVVVGLLGFALTLSLVVGAVNSRIGRLEGVISAKLNGAFTQLCDDVRLAKTDINSVKIDIATLKTDVNTLKEETR